MASFRDFQAALGEINQLGSVFRQKNNNPRPLLLLLLSNRAALREMN